MIEIVCRERENKLYFIFPIKNLILDINTFDPKKIKKKIMYYLNHTSSYKKLNKNIKNETVRLILKDLYLIEGKKLFKKNKKQKKYG